MLLDSQTSTSSENCPSSTGSAADDAAMPSFTCSSSARDLGLSDEEMLQMAVDVSQTLQWDVLQREILAANTAWKRRKFHHDEIAVYTRKNAKEDTYAVVTVSELPCCIEELWQIFSARTTSAYCDFMTAIWNKDFMYGEVLHEVDNVESMLQRMPRPRSKSRAQTDSSLRAHLTIKTAVFEKANLFHKNEEWVYLDLVEMHVNPDDGCKVSTRTLLSLHPNDVQSNASWQGLHTKRHTESVFASYTFEERPDGRSTLMRIFADCSLEHPKQRKWLKHLMSGNGSNDRTTSRRLIKNRLLSYALPGSELLRVIRRRRLGLQVLLAPEITEARRSVSVSQCDRCLRAFLAMHHKVCSLCGSIVCEKCSDMHERKSIRRSFSHSTIELIRVCQACIERVDRCRFENVSMTGMMRARIFPDRTLRSASDISRSDSSSPMYAMVNSTTLTDLLEEKLKTPDPIKRKSVLNVIQCIMDQEFEKGSPLDDNALEDMMMQLRLSDDPLPLDQCLLANEDGRTYTIAPGENPLDRLPSPIPKDEARRLEIVKTIKMEELNKSQELELLCEVAAEQLNCVASLITITEKDTYQSVISNQEQFVGRTFERNDGFCNQLIMENKPLLVPHPEADIRFSNLQTRQQLSVHFYIGFPLTAADNTVIGSICCVDQQSREVTQSQYTAMKRLAETASKIVQRHSS